MISRRLLRFPLSREAIFLFKIVPTSVDNDRINGVFGFSDLKASMSKLC
jgi:hypothetical protein